MDTRDIYKLVRQFEEEKDDVINLYDSMDIELNEGFVIETGVVGFMEDGIIVHLDEDAMEFLDFNGVLLESENLNESVGDVIADELIRLITTNHVDLLSKFGPEAVMAAIDDVAADIDDYEHDVGEIGTSDRSNYKKQYVDSGIEDVISRLEAGHYKHLHEDGYNPTVHSVEDFWELYDESDDAFDLLQNAILGDYGENVRKAVQEMYDDVVNDSGYRLHPDDDFEEIIGRIIDSLDRERGYNTGQIDELTVIKKLALGETNSKECPACHGDGGFNRLSPTHGHHTVPCKTCNGTGEVDDDDDDLYEAPGDFTVKTISAADAWKKHTDPKKADINVPKDPKTGKTLYQKVQGLDKSKSSTPKDPKTGKTLYQKIQNIDEAEYQGRKVQLNKPMQGDVKKSKVYVKKPNGKVVKVNFGDKNMKIKKSNPERRKSFRARHNCDNPGPKWKARYWSCRAW